MSTPARPPPTAALPCLAFLLACNGPQSALQPSGEAARSIGALTLALAIVAILASLAVIAALLWIVLRTRKADVPEERALRWVLWSGAAVPGIVIVAVFAASVLLLGSLARRGENARLTIALTGHRWWWSVQYLQPEGGAVSTVTANEIHIPVGQRVRIELLARDVIHSLWVPRLNGKVDLVPGRTNTIWLHADRPGVYRGQCAEFCGLQHARMALYVVAHEPGEFERWLAREREPAAVPAAGSAVEAGFRVFQASCASCHTVRGTTARSVIGPDLTHVASRRSLAAGTLPNTIGHLAAWVAAPQRIKPGSGMPNPQLSAVALQQVGQYLATLR